MSLLLACDSGDKQGPKKTEPAKASKADAKKADAKKADAKKADAKKADAKKADAKKADPPAKPGEVHFDVTHDKSGVLARSAAALEASGKFDNEDLHELSHHAEKLPSAETVCKHVAAIRGTGDDLTECIKATEHHVVQLGPELYAEDAACRLAAKTPAEIDVCDAAEKEAEAALHAKPHGDGLDKETCDTLFDHFEEMAMAAGDNPEIVKEVLEEVRPDVVITCMEQGTKAEIECSMKTKTLHELRECASKML
ncbi:MAG: hypothetical protein K0V04_36480 [Deltaproteobacteria bacterium]|nr:hypothetical protein [Deltaproteobacteria bacterium]